MNTQQTEYLWPVKTRGGETVFVPADLNQMTSYVLLEKQDWFEEEVGFARKLAPLCSHMFDIGANHGVYSLSMAQANPVLRVQAFEPTVAARRLQLAVQHNGFGDRFVVHPVALADKETELFFPDTPDTELNSASDDEHEQGTRISAFPLNPFLQERLDDQRIFVKLDVEGMEVSVIAGGSRLFREAQPIVMFELKNGQEINTILPPLWKGLGYQIYRHLPGLDLLIPYTEDFEEGYLLNLFAIKPPTAQWLEQQGLLITTPPNQIAFEPTTDQLTHSSHAYLQAQELRDALLDLQLDLQHPHDAALARWHMAQAPTQPARTRLACLHQAQQLVQQHLAEAQDIASLLLLLRITQDLGQRTMALNLARHALTLVSAGHLPTRHHPEAIAAPAYQQATKRDAAWLKAQLQEFLLRFSSYSSYFSGLNPPYLRELLDTQPHTPYVERVALLASARNLTPNQLAAGLPFFDPAHDPNAHLMRRLAFGGLADAFSAHHVTDPIRIVDIGAASHGALSEPYASLLLAGCSKVYGFEPHPPECEKVARLYEQRGWPARFEHWFIGDGTTRTFHFTHEPQCCSLYEPNPAVLSEFGNLAELVQLQRTETVQTRRLDEVLEEGCDFLKMDIQGAELDVLQHARHALSECLLVWLEVEFIPLYKEQPLFAEVDAFLREQGFRFFCFDYFGQGRRRDALPRTPQWRIQQVWADAIYVIDPARWPHLAADRLRKLAMLYEMIGAGDHVSTVLSLLEKDHPGLHDRYAQRYYLPGADPI